MKSIKLLMLSILLLFTTMVHSGEPIDKVLDVRANGTVSIESMNGEVEIIGWDKEQVSVKGKLDKNAKGYDFETDGGYTVFKVLMPKSKRGYNGSRKSGSQLTIHVPKLSKVEFESVNGNVNIRDVAGGANVHSVNGHVSGEKLKKRITLKTVNGNIDANDLDGKIKLATVNGKVNSKDTQGRVSFETINGAIYADSQAKEIDAENVNGSVELKLTQAEEVEVTTVNGDVELDVTLMDDTQLSATSVSGSIELSLAGKVGGDFNLSTHAGGDIKNRLTSDKVKKHRYAPGKDLRIELSGGDAKINVTSVSGELSIKRQKSSRGNLQY